jgi:hypothetical protein
MAQRTLHMLESFTAQGSDGAHYKVCAYEQMVRADTLPTDGREHWEPTGIAEYRLDDGRLVEMGRDGALRVAATGVALQPHDRG